MYNVATIYRFNTPFLELEKEKFWLASVIKKIEKSIRFDWMDFEKKTEILWNYYKLSLKLNDNMWLLEFFYIKDEVKEYFLPVFKLNIYLNISFLETNNTRKNTISFLNNIFECFDWLNEKEFLVDISNNLYFKKSIFWSKNYASHDFSDIEEIRNKFEESDWIKLLEDFIKKFSGKKFALSTSNSKYYHKLHWILLYFIYLIFIMYQNKENNRKVKQELEKINFDWLYEWQIDLMKKRLSYVDDLHYDTFNMYKQRLELFFKLF